MKYRFAILKLPLWLEWVWKWIAVHDWIYIIYCWLFYKQRWTLSPTPCHYNDVYGICMRVIEELYHTISSSVVVNIPWNNPYRMNICCLIYQNLVTIPHTFSTVWGDCTGRVVGAVRSIWRVAVVTGGPCHELWCQVGVVAHALVGVSGTMERWADNGQNPARAQHGVLSCVNTRLGKHGSLTGVHVKRGGGWHEQIETNQTKMKLTWCKQVNCPAC